MNQEQLNQAAVTRDELEYLFDDGQWLPAAIERYNVRNGQMQSLTIQLLRFPREHSGVINLDMTDVEQRLHLKGGH